MIRQLETLSANLEEPKWAHVEHVLLVGNQLRQVEQRLCVIESCLGLEQPLRG